MSNWKLSLVGPDATIREAVERIESSLTQIAMVVDENQTLLGTVTDGDVRRGILRGLMLDGKVRDIMNPNPTTATMNQSRENILMLMKQRQLHQIPVVDEKHRVVGIEILDEILQTTTRKNQVIIMAGGLGSRLLPLTEDCPKPMLRIGQKPILETILENFIEYGFARFTFAVNYKAEMVKQYFDDGRKWGVAINYIQENERLGTAGALSLLSEKPQEPVLVMNGDLLTKINFQHLLDFHAAHGAAATMCVREYEHQVPYGVVNIEGEGVTSISEKPMQRHFVNAGIYVLEPETLGYIPSKTYLDMPALFERLLGDKMRVCAFPIREYWLDVGQITDFEKARGEFHGVFG